MKDCRLLGVSSLAIAGGFLFVIATTVVTSPVLAQSSDAERACTSDAMSLCSNLISEGNRSKIASCLARNRSSLSADCRAVMGGKSSKRTKRRVRRR
jgi:hypothetical protein